MEKLCWILFSMLVTTASPYKILLIYPLPSRSHGMLGDGLTRHLLAAGHEITYITPFTEREPTPNLTLVDVASNIKIFDPQALDIKAIMSKTIVLNEDFVIDWMIDIGKGTFEHTNVQNLLKDPNVRFDVVIGEWMFSQIVASFGPVFNCPFIWVSSLEPHWLVTTLVDEALHPAYNPDFKADYLPPFTFSQRVQQLWSLVSGEYKRKFIFLAREEEIYNSGIAPVFTAKGMPVPKYVDVVYNASLILSNSHVSMGLPTRLPQNLISIGGYHIDSHVIPLPKDLKSIIESAKEGVIYFSMGSNLKSKDLPQELKNSLVKMFSGLKQTVLWKFEDPLPNIPKNVHILKWAPQQSILAHPNVVLFITHGGLLSTAEAIHYAVPIIGIPVFADQFSNINRATEKGFARKVDLSITMAGELKEAIDDVLNNEKYKLKIKELSFIYHHRPVPPGVELVHWVEHVVRTRGAPHLRSAALMMPWYQKMYLDLAVLIVSVIATLVLVIKRIFHRIKSGINVHKKNI